MKQPTPRKGTETTTSSKAILIMVETTHTPQGDGNNAQSCFRPAVLETTHTPQGDGNFLAAFRLSVSNRNNPHPARGRKHYPLPLYGILITKQPTPRKGTENPYIVAHRLLIPKQPTPRKGTENHLCSHCRNCWRSHSHPRQGTTDKKRSVRHLESRKRARQLRLSAARHR